MMHYLSVDSSVVSTQTATTAATDTVTIDKALIDGDEFSIPDSQLTTHHLWDHDPQRVMEYSPKNSRLHTQKRPGSSSGAWSPKYNRLDEWIQV